ncbi:hypothetical protein Cgig2_026872 [Carnegiea gigantea]|uniref:Uncharacterized protein n=1 Tax=Carnegiea gigantea TaxID=171969 RepID=A0A9Q1QQ34_9CARY|nr:hypothetical protein Cgig2_026872 [Carnegiea gigantea]
MVIEMCNDMKKKMVVSCAKVISKSKDLESFVGCSLPNEIEIHPPNPSNTKGSGKRIKGGKEAALEQQQKRQRHCDCAIEIQLDIRLSHSETTQPQKPIPPEIDKDPSKLTELTNHNKPKFHTIIAFTVTTTDFSYWSNFERDNIPASLQADEEIGSDGFDHEEGLGFSVTKTGFPDLEEREIKTDGSQFGGERNLEESAVAFAA